MSAPRDPTAAAARIAASLDDAGIDYAIGGALALAAHGLPRATIDADIGAFVAPAEVDALFDALPIAPDPRDPRRTTLDELARRFC